MSSRELTPEECRTQFLGAVRRIAAAAAVSQGKTPEHKCNEVAFNILCLIDGITGAGPAIDLVTRPAADDKAFLGSQGEDYWPTGAAINDCLLHELFHASSAR